MSDGGGLFLEIRPNGAKLWRYAYRVGGKQNLYAMGSYPELTLQDARTIHIEARALVSQGKHPSHERAREKRENIATAAGTFKSVAEEWFAESNAGWSDHYRGQIRRALDNDLYPVIGRLPIKAVTPADMLAIVRKAIERGPHAAAIVRKTARYVFTYAIANLKADSDPTYPIRHVIKMPQTKHASPKSADDIRILHTRLNGYGGMRTTVIAVELLLLLFVRTKEIRTAFWSEFNLDGEVWTIPPARMKMRRPHVVPLCPRAVELLQELYEITGGSPILFPNVRDEKRPMSNMTINRALEYMGFKPTYFTGHDFRATASTWLHEHGFQHEVIELQLAHMDDDKSSAPYNHALYLPARKEMMNVWADWLNEIKVSAPAPTRRPRGRRAPMRRTRHAP